MEMTETQISEAIMSKLKEIRALLEKNGGFQYLTLTIFDDGVVMFNNKHWNKKENKGLYLCGYEAYEKK